MHLSIKNKTSMINCVVTLDINKKTGKPVDFEFNSNMHMYYAFDNYIYSFLSITSHAFLVWQAYFFFLVYANNFLNCTHTCMYTKYQSP